LCNRIKEFLSFDGAGFADELMVDDKLLSVTGFTCTFANVEHLSWFARITLLCSQVVDGAWLTVEALAFVITNEGSFRRTGGKISIGCTFVEVCPIGRMGSRAIIPVCDI
jgi:hypothetical protein